MEISKILLFVRFSCIFPLLLWSPDCCRGFDFTSSWAFAEQRPLSIGSKIWAVNEKNPRLIGPITGIDKEYNGFPPSCSFQFRVLKLRFLAFPQGPGGFRKLRGPGRNRFHLSWYLSVPGITSYGQKPRGGNFFVRRRYNNLATHRTLPRVELVGGDKAGEKKRTNNEK